MIFFKCYFLLIFFIYYIVLFGYFFSFFCIHDQYISLSYLIMIIGRSTDIVDANLNVLKERIEMVKVKERFERCCKCQHGWNYVPLSINDHTKTKRDKELRSFIQLIGLVFGTIGLTSFAGTFFLCLVSLLAHLQVDF